MVAVSRCLGSFFLLALSGQGARISRKRAANLTGNAQDCYSQYDGLPLLQLNPCKSTVAKSIFSRLHELECTTLGPDFVEEMQDCSQAEVVCSQEAAVELLKDGIASVVNADAGAHWRGSSGPTAAFSSTDRLGVASDFYSNWRDLDTLNARVDSLVQASGGVATIEVAGQSVEGRDIRLVRFRGAGYSPGKTRVFVTYVVHGREWITAMAGVYQVEQLIEHVNQNPNYLDETEVVIMPMSNPDGFYYSTVSSRMHRKNMARNAGSNCVGVDLNRNFDVAWSQPGASSNPCSDTFYGSAPASEPETQAIASVLNEAPTTLYIDVHSYTLLVISSYVYTRANHPRAADYRAVGGLMTAAMKDVDGITYTEGAGAQVLYVASGVSTDYADKQGALGICIEMRPSRYNGGGFAPPVSDILPGSQESYVGVLAAIDYSKGYVPPAPTPAPPPGTWQLTGSGCEMDGNCIQSNNHPSNYGNNQQCDVQLYGSIPLEFETFSTESRYDTLTVGGQSYSGTSRPRAGSYSGTIAWASDYSVSKTGWRFCRTDG